MRKIQILGTGCPKCKKLYEVALKVVKDAAIEAAVTKVEDIQEILNFGVMMTPALVIDGEVKVAGRVPRPDEILSFLNQ
jgi:small redox-active disulfide protein 2